MWITITLVALRFSDTSFTFPQTPETTKIAVSRIFLILQRICFDVDDDHFVFLTPEHDYFHYETSFTFPQTPETTKIA